MVWVRNTSKHPPATLSFEIPENIDPRAAVILQQTEEGWVIAECLEGLPGGTVSPDGKYIYIVREETSKYATAWWLYQHVTRHFEKLPDPALPPIIEVKEAKPSSLYQGYLDVEVSLESPRIGWDILQGIWYKIDVSGDDNVKLEGSKYLVAGEKREVKIISPGMGRHATLCLNTKDAFPRAALDWANRLGVPGTEAELMLDVIERTSDKSYDFKDLVWAVKKLLMQKIWKLMGSKIKFFANLVPVSFDMAVQINALTDTVADPCVEIYFEGTIEGEEEVVEESEEKAQPTAIQIPPGWKKFEGDSVELWLPKSYLGSSEVGWLANLMEPSDVIYAFDSDPGFDAGFEGILTMVSVNQKRVLSSIPMDIYLDTIIKQELVCCEECKYNMVERGIVPLNHYQAGYIVSEVTYEGKHWKDIRYAIKSDSNIWIVNYSTKADEFDQRLPTFKKSIRTFVIKP